MKTKNHTSFLLLLAAFMLAACATSGLSKEERRAQTRQHVEECLAARSFKIDVRDMQTLRYGSRNLTSVWNVEVRNDSLISYLPYFGNAYSVRPYGSSNSKGLNFSERILSYEQERNQRKDKRKHHHHEEHRDDGKELCQHDLRDGDRCREPERLGVRSALLGKGAHCQQGNHEDEIEEIVVKDL